MQNKSNVNQNVNRCFLRGCEYVGIFANSISKLRYKFKS